MVKTCKKCPNKDSVLTDGTVICRAIGKTRIKRMDDCSYSTKLYCGKCGETCQKLYLYQDNLICNNCYDKAKEKEDETT